MLPYAGDFEEAIKQQARDVNVVIAYKSDDNYIFLQKDNIQSLTYNAIVNKELGGVVKKVADIKAVYNEYTISLKEGTPINLYYKCGVDGVCKKALLYISQVKENKAKTILTIEALDYLSYTEVNSTLPLVKNTDLVSYESLVFKTLGYAYRIGNDVVNPKLTLGYPKSTKLLTTLEEMAVANQALIDFMFDDTFCLYVPFYLPGTFMLPLTDDGYIEPSDSFEVHIKKFGFGEIVDILDEDTDLISFGLDDDSSNKYEDVRVNIFFPSSSDQKSLGKVTATIPGSAIDYNVGTIEFGNTMIPQVCIFNDKVDVADYTIGSDSFSFSVNNSDALVKNIEAEMYGLDISTATLKDTDTDIKCKQVSNMYIQSATVYDTRIYKYPNCTLRTFGNPLYEVGDTLAIGDKQVLILEETLTFNGGLKGTLKGVVLDETD